MIKWYRSIQQPRGLLIHSSAGRSAWGPRMWQTKFLGTKGPKLARWSFQIWWFNPPRIWIQWVYNQYQLLVCCFKHFLFWKLCVFQGYQPVIFCVFNDPFWALIILNHSHGVILAVTFCLGHSEVAVFFYFYFPSQGFVVPPVWIIIMRDRTDIAIVNGFY